MLETQRWARQRAESELRTIESVIEINDRAARVLWYPMHPSEGDDLMRWGIYPRAKLRRLYVLRCSELRLEIKRLDRAIEREARS